VGSIKRRRLDEPDERRPFEKGVGELTRLGTLTIGRALLEPGWRWSSSLGSAMDTPSCPIHHTQLVVAGRIAVQMDDGELMEMEPNDVIDVPPGHDAWVIGDEPVILLDFAGNIGSVGLPQDPERLLTTMVMTDIVGSTRIASALGDRSWKQLLASHDHVVRRQLERFRGAEAETTGDGFLATFTSPVAAVRAAVAISEAVREIGLEVRVGVHTGEIEVGPTGFHGIAIHATARIMSLGGASEVLVSSVTRGLVDGSELSFAEHGRHQLKGLDRPIDVFRVVGDLDESG
jgi:class 3 adenylate cyclase